MSESWRLFVAVPISHELRVRLARDVADWARHPDLADLRWTDPESWHVTLAFLGSTPSAQVDGVAEVVAAVSERHEPFDTSAGSLGAFPSQGRARVVWYGVADPERRIGALAADLRTGLGLDVHAAFRPHVTLARTRHDSIDARAWLRDAIPPAGVIRFDAMHLMRSHLGRGPARYEAVATARLSEPARV